VFTNWAVLIGYIILFNLIVTFLLAVLNRASPALCDALRSSQSCTQLSVPLPFADLGSTGNVLLDRAVSTPDARQLEGMPQDTMLCPD
jgi:hypothetical protein